MDSVRSKRYVHVLGFVIATALVQVAALGASAQQISLEDVPPVVVKTIPEAGSAEVDPALKQIEIAFSKPMLDRSWSFAEVTKDSAVPPAGKAGFKPDQRTWVLPAKLEPNKTYAVWVNSEKFRNFKDTAGRPSVPYLLVFRTGAAKN